MYITADTSRFFFINASVLFRERNNFIKMADFKKPLSPTNVAVKSDTATNDDSRLNVKAAASNARTQDVQISEKLSDSALVQSCPYKVPNWSRPPSDGSTKYAFEVLKSGQIIDEVKDLQHKAFWTFGRLPENDIEMAHPTISRFHAILQYRPKADTHNPESEEQDSEKDDKINNVKLNPAEGWYIYDLGSTHGTFVNKQRVPSKVYIRIRVGHILRLGASTRSYILQGPVEDEEPESDLSITELKAAKQHEREEAELKARRSAEEADARASNEGCNWGMGDDADEETDLTHNPYATTNNEELFLDDPKKTLRGYFEREGLQLEYKCDEMSAGSFVCRVELPLDNEHGRPIIAEVVHKGKKKDCVVQCALEACRILDRHGVLRQANQEPQRRKQIQRDSDDDDDEFWDRTGDVAKKRQRKTTQPTPVTLTYDDLLKKESNLHQELNQVASNILSYQEQQRHLKTQKQLGNEDEDLDSFMQNLRNKEEPMDRTEIKRLRLEEQRLKAEIERTRRLVKIAKPANIALVKNPLSSDCIDKKSTNTRQLPMIGKRNQFSKFKVVKQSAISVITAQKPKLDPDSAEEEEEEDTQASTIKCHEGDDNASNTQDTCEISNKSAMLASPSEETHSQQTESIGSSKESTDEIMVQLIAENHSSSDNLTEAQVNEVSKKRRQRIRQRTKRQEFDLDEEEYESSDKYAKWMPPENQTGDGFTELNKKFGY